MGVWNQGGAIWVDVGCLGMQLIGCTFTSNTVLGEPVN